MIMPEGDAERDDDDWEDGDGDHPSNTDDE